MKHLTLATIALVALLTTAWAVAQPPESPPPGPPGVQGPPPQAPPDGKGLKRPGPHMGRDGNPNKAREMLEQVMIARLSSELKLNDEQSLVLMRRFNEAREEKQALNKARAEAMRDLRGLVEQQKDETALQDCLARLHDLDAKLSSYKQRLQETMGADLSPWQKAKLALFLEQFETDIRQMLREARERRNGPPFGPMGMMPGQGMMQPGMPGMQPGMQPGGQSRPGMQPMPGMGPQGFGPNPMQPGPNGPRPPQGGFQQGPPPGQPQAPPQGPPPQPPAPAN